MRIHPELECLECRTMPSQLLGSQSDWISRPGQLQRVGAEIFNLGNEPLRLDFVLDTHFGNLYSHPHTQAVIVGVPFIGPVPFKRGLELQPGKGLELFTPLVLYRHSLIGESIFVFEDSVTFTQVFGAATWGDFLVGHLADPPAIPQSVKMWF